jgi:hypothetical protein
LPSLCTATLTGIPIPPVTAVVTLPSPLKVVSSVPFAL